MATTERNVNRSLLGVASVFGMVVFAAGAIGAEFASMQSRHDRFIDDARADFASSQGFDLTKIPDSNGYLVDIRQSALDLKISPEEVLGKAFAEIRRETGCQIPPMATSYNPREPLLIVPDCK